MGQNYSQLSLEERCSIAQWYATGQSIQKIAVAGHFTWQIRCGNEASSRRVYRQRRRFIAISVAIAGRPSFFKRAHLEKAAKPVFDMPSLYDLAILELMNIDSHDFDRPSL